jgi:hypothetical protein
VKLFFQFRRQGRRGAPRFCDIDEQAAGAPVFLKDHKPASQVPLLLAAFILAAPSSHATPLQVVTRDNNQCVFEGAARPIEVAFHNSDDKMATVEIRTQIYQTATAIAMPLAEPHTWKILEILPGQTILETNLLTFPSVSQGTGFLVQWLDDTNGVLGRKDVMVYPRRLFDALGPLCRNKPPGIFDPQNRIKPLLNEAGLVFEDLEIAGMNNFSGRLAIIDEISLMDGQLARLEPEIRGLASNGAAVVWIKPSVASGPMLEPAVYTVAVGRGTVTVVRPCAISNLAESPLAQLNLVRAVELAMKPDLLSANNNQP